MRQVFSFFFMLTMFLSISVCSFAQDIATGELFGKVTDYDGNPLPGASVQIEGDLKGAIAGKDGDYTIPGIKEGDISVRVTFIGYRSYSVNTVIKGRMELNFTLELSDIFTGEVVVTATRAGSRTPQTYSTVDVKKIQQNLTGRDIPFILGLTPSLVETSEAGNGIGYTNMRIRGTDANRINVTFDGIPLNDPESQQVFWVNMPDIASSVDNIQVQRGVGTSSNGPASFGATISLDSKLPENEPSAYISSSLGSFNTSKLTVAAGSGLVDGKFAMQIRLSNVRSDGYVYRTGSDHKSAMVTALYRTNKSLVRANVIYGKEHTGIGWWGNPMEMVGVDRRYNPAGEYYDNDGNQHFYDNESDNYTQTHFQLSWNREMSEELSFSSSVFYTIGEGYYEEYKDGATLVNYGIDNIFDGGIEILESDIIRQKWMRNDYLGLIYSLKLNREVFDASVGGTINYFKGDHFGEIVWAEQSIPINNSYRWYFNTGNKGEASVYGKGELMITDDLSVYGDIQYRFVNYEMEGPDDDFKQLDQKHGFHFINPKAGIYYSINNSQNAYLSFSIGNREPTRSDYKEAAGDEEAMPRAETLYDTELGYSLKTSQLSASINLYAMLYDNQLVPTGELSNTGYSIMTNVDKSYRLGVELNTGIQVFKFLEWEVGATLSRNKIIDFKEYFINYNTSDWSESYGSKNLGLVDISYSPRLIWSSDMDFNLLPSLDFHFISKYVGKQYFDNTMNDERALDPYFVNNAVLNWNPSLKKINGLTLQFLVNNIFNNMYSSNGYGGNWYEDGEEKTWAYYFPQSGINFMFRIALEM